MKYIYGIDIGGTTVKIGLLDLEGNFVDKWEIVTDKSEEGKNILRDIAISVIGYNKAHNIDNNDIKGYGFGIPGPVVNNYVAKCVNLGWKNLNIVREFSKYMGNVTVEANNDANVAAAGEMWKGGGIGHKNVCMFTLGTGVGGGIIVDSHIVEGANGAGGELGHIKVVMEGGNVCGCGRRGCLETVASATGIVREARRLFATNTLPTRLIDNDTLSAKVIFDKAKDNDEFALKLVDQLGYYLGYAAGMVANTVNPEVFIIGGGVSKAGQILIDVIKKHFVEFCFPGLEETEFKLASLSNDAGMIGAAYLVK